MRSIFKRAAVVASLALASTVAVTGASAATIVNTGTITLVGNSGTFTSAHSAAGEFTDVFTFDTGVLGRASASISSIRIGKLGDIDFTSILLNNVAFTPTLQGAIEFWSLDNIELAAGTHTITINGKSNASSAQNANYSGTISIAAVPEPATWGMLVLGFGLVGAGMRARKSKGVTVLA